MKKPKIFFLKCGLFFVLLLFGIFVFLSSAKAATRTISNSGGLWNSTSTWIEGIVPTASDDVVATSTSGNVTINSNASVRSINLTNYTGTITHNANVVLNIGDSSAGLGNIALFFPSLGWNYVLGNPTTSSINFVSSSPVVQEVNFGGKTAGNISFTSTNNNGSWKLTGSLITDFGATLTLTRGTLDLNGQTVNIGLFNSSNTNTRTLDLGSGTLNLTGTGTVFNVQTSTGLTLPTTNGTIKITNTSNSNVTFAGGGKTYGNIWFSRGSSTGSNIISGSNTFLDFKDDGSAAHSILFSADTNTSLSSFTVSGSPGNLIKISSTTTATHTLTKTGGGIVSSDYLDIQHSVATPNNTWYAGNNSINNQNIPTAGSGWIFTGVIPSLTLDKIVINDNGGQAPESSWIISAIGPSSISGPGSSGNQDVVSGPSFQSGVYRLELSGGQEGYNTGQWACTNGIIVNENNEITLSPGQETVCSITSNDISPTLTVLKIVINHGGNKSIDDFPLFVNSFPVISGALNEFPAGSYVVSEIEDSQYNVSFNADCDQSGSITLVLANNYLCIITNEEKPAYITVEKTLINYGGQSDIDDFAPYTIDGNIVALGVPIQVNSGTHVIGEVFRSNYTTEFNGHCDENGNITIQANESKTCVIINTCNVQGSCAIIDNIYADNLAYTDSAAPGVSGAGLVTFRWNYQSAGGTFQKKFQFQVTKHDDPDFTNVVINRTFSNLYNPPGTLNQQSLLVRLTPASDSLLYNTVYIWRVKVWDLQNNESDWIMGPIYIRSGHPEPYVFFTWSPGTVLVNSTVFFTNQSICYDTQGPIDCQSYFWQFGDGNVSNQENPNHIYGSPGPVNVNLRVTDDVGPYEIIWQITIYEFAPQNQNLPLPKWREISPF